MILLSTTSPSSTKLFTCSTAPRVSSSHSTSRIFYSVKSGCARKWSRRRSSLVFCAADKMKSSSRNTAAAAAVVDSASDQHEISPHQTFLDARTEQELLLGIQKEVEAGRLPINVAQGMEELYHNYRNAAPPVFSALDVLALDKGGGYFHLKQPSVPLLVFQSGHPKSDEIVLSNMAVTLDRVFLDVRDPFQFSPYHEAIREPFDYYMFGQKYIRPLLDFRPAPKMAYGTDDIRGTLKRRVYHELWTTWNLLTPLIQTSFVGNISLFDEMEKKLEQGENVILISNHQTEADPAVIALLLESTNPFIAENIIFVAGDRVVTDPLCKPFSMGRNLLCVYSKNHMNDDPELIDMKKRANTKSLKEMALLLRGGSKIIWIAPSGGRDRPDPVTKEWFPAPFDASSVDNMRRLAEHAGAPGRVYPLAISCHDIMPPPAQVEKEIGERRVISFHGVGLSVAPSIDYHEVASALEDLEEAKLAYTESLYSSACEQYNVLKSAIHGKQGLGASTPTVSLSQPWQ